MKKFRDLKVGDYFYYIRDIEITVYKIKDIVDHVTNLTISGVDVESSKPDCIFNVYKNMFDACKKNGMQSDKYVDAYFSDCRKALNEFNEIVDDYKSLVNDAEYNLGRFKLITAGLDSEVSDKNRIMSMTVYRIWRRGFITSGGFTEYYDEPTERMFLSKESAEANLPSNINEQGVSWEYYVKEVEINE